MMSHLHYVNIETCLYEIGYDIIDVQNLTITVALTRHLFKDFKALYEAENKAWRLESKIARNVLAKARSLTRSRPRHWCSQREEKERERELNQ